MQKRSKKYVTLPYTFIKKKTCNKNITPSQ